MSETDRCLIKHDISLRVGHRIFPPEFGASAAVLQAVQIFNNPNRISAVLDELNPALLDDGKVAAFLSGLCRLADERLGMLGHAILHLNHPGLQLSQASPVTVEILLSEYDLSVPEHDDGKLVQPTLISEIDEQMARARAAAAQEALAPLEGKVRELESIVDSASDDDDEVGDVLRALSENKFALFAAASAWRDNAASLAQLHPGNRELARNLEDAQQAVLANVAPPRTGMPGPPG
jgi:hypothetical protein